MRGQLQNLYLEQEQTSIQDKYPFLNTHAVDSDQITKHFKDQSSFQYEIIQPPDSTVESAFKGQTIIPEPTKISPVREAPIDFMQNIKDIKQSRDKYEQIALAFERKDAFLQAKLLESKRKLKKKRKFRGESEGRSKEEEIISNAVIASYLRGDRIEIDGATAAERFFEDEQEFNSNKTKHLQTSQRLSPDNQGISSISSIFYGNSSLGSCQNNSQNRNRNSSSYNFQDNGFSPLSQLPTLSSPLSLRNAESPLSQATTAPNNSISPYLKVKNHRHFSQSTNNSHLPVIGSPTQGFKSFPLHRDSQISSKTNQDLPKQRLVFQELMSQIDRVREGSLDDNLTRNDDCQEQSLFPISEIEKKTSKQQSKEIGQVSMYLEEQMNARAKRQQEQLKNRLGQAGIALSCDNHPLVVNNQLNGVTQNVIRKGKEDNLKRNIDITKKQSLNNSIKNTVANEQVNQQFSNINRNSPSDDQFDKRIMTEQDQSTKLDGIQVKNNDILLTLPDSRSKTVNENNQSNTKKNTVQPEMLIQMNVDKKKTVNSPPGFIFQNIPPVEKLRDEKIHGVITKGRKLNVSREQKNNKSPSTLSSQSKQNQLIKGLEKQQVINQNQLQNSKISDDFKTQQDQHQEQLGLSSEILNENLSSISILSSEQQYPKFNKINTKLFKPTNNSSRVKSHSFFEFKNKDSLQIDSSLLQEKQKLFSPQNKPRKLSPYQQAYFYRRSKPLDLAKVEDFIEEIHINPVENKENNQTSQPCYEPSSLKLHPCENTIENQEENNDSSISEELDNQEKNQYLNEEQQQLQQENEDNCQEIRQQSQQVRVRVLSLPVEESRQRMNRKNDFVVFRGLQEAAALAEKQRKRSSTFQIQQQELMGDSVAGLNSQRKQTRNRQNRILQNYQATRAPLLIKNKIDKEFADIIALCPNL